MHPKKLDEIQMIYGSQPKKDHSDSIVTRKNVNPHKLPKLKLNKDENLLPKIIPSILNRNPSSKQILSHRQVSNSVETKLQNKLRLQYESQEPKSYRSRPKRKLDSL